MVLQLLLDLLQFGLLLLVGLALGRLDLDGVAEGILDLLRRGVAINIFVLGNGLTLTAKASGLHDPFLLGHRVSELPVMGNDNHATIVILDSLRQRAETIAIEVIRRLIENDQ